MSRKTENVVDRQSVEYLYGRIKWMTGEVDGPEPDFDLFEKKLVGDPAEYGAAVRIVWDDKYEGWESDYEDGGEPEGEDFGYLFGLPGASDPDMDLVVHCPHTQGEKDDGGPMWMTLYDLLSLPTCKRVEVARCRR